MFNFNGNSKRTKLNVRSQIKSVALLLSILATGCFLCNNMSSYAEVDKTIKHFSKKEQLFTTLDYGENEIIAGSGSGQYIYFGEYPQNSYYFTEAPSSLKNGEVYNNGGERFIYVTGKQYGGVGRYYKYEPVKWRILKNEGEKLYLFSDVCLDAHNYDDRVQAAESVTWADSGLRYWLTINFFNGVFNRYEQEHISHETINYSHAQTQDGKTYDWAHSPGDLDPTTLVPLASLEDQQIWLLSGDNSGEHAIKYDNQEINNTNFGFTNESKKMHLTEYAKANGAADANPEGSGTDSIAEFWWTRSSLRASYLNIVSAFASSFWGNVSGYVGSSNSDFCIAPAFKLNLNGVAFASTVPPITKKFFQISDKSGMYLRFIDPNATDTIITASEDGSEINVSKMRHDQRLIIQGINEDGTSWYFSLPADGSGSLSVNISELANYSNGILLGDTNFLTTKAWVERTGLAGLLYVSATNQDISLSNPVIHGSEKPEENNDNTAENGQTNDDAIPEPTKNNVKTSDNTVNSALNIAVVLFAAAGIIMKSTIKKFFKKSNSAKTA